MNHIDFVINTFIVLWAVIDPIGTVPVFIAITNKYDSKDKIKIAKNATFFATIILLFFMFVGEVLLRNMGVPLAAFQASGGIILFLFAINMIFGDSKPEEEIGLIKSSEETAIFPLAIPSIAGPGAILALVLTAETSKGNSIQLSIIVFVLIFILALNYLMMRLSHKINNFLGRSGAIVISKIMGLILASIAANNILMGIKDFFKI